MRRTTTVALVAAVLLALTAAAALAATIDDCPQNDLQNYDYDCSGTDGDDTVNGTPGPDYMTGLKGKDTLNGFDGDDKIDAADYDKTIPQEDTVSGGPGNDTIGANDGLTDHIDCGPGSRDIAYSDKGKDTVSSNCEWRRSYDTPRYCPGDGIPWTEPGVPADWPYGVSDVRGKSIWCIDGSRGDDKKLDGTTGHSDLLDSIWADKGNDTLNGGLGPDTLEGWSGNDILKGGAGTDFLYGDSSAHPLYNGFFKGAGKDKIYGGPGDDYIAAIDNKKDTISCGGGTDLVQADESGFKDEDLTSTVTDKIVNRNDCEEIRPYAEGSLFWCRRYGHRKHH
jgi:Ca2+-binding RTX toxin-like protein